MAFMSEIWNRHNLFFISLNILDCVNICEQLRKMEFRREKPVRHTYSRLIVPDTTLGMILQKQWLMITITRRVEAIPTTTGLPPFHQQWPLPFFHNFTFVLLRSPMQSRYKLLRKRRESHSIVPDSNVPSSSCVGLLDVARLVAHIIRSLSGSTIE